MAVTQSHKTYKSQLTTGILKQCLGGILVLLFSAYGCGDSKPPVRPAANVQPAAAQQAAQPPLAELLAEDTASQQGYIYERKNRRDPFIPLILPTKRIVIKGKAKTGTLESYDLSEFMLAAIAKKGSKYYALLVTPDTRSFTVFKGTRIGISNGTVKSISDKKVILLENSKDYKGELQPREIILEFIKGEGE